MNRIEKVSIGGRAFHLGTEAYETLKRYLGELEAHYSCKGQEGREILEGIEERLAELLCERSGSGRVVSEAVVNEAIKTLGKPSDIEEESAAEEPSAQEKPKKHLYRDTVDKILGGVCSGIAAYLHIDAVLVRVIFVVLFFMGVHIDNKTGVSAVSSGVVIAYLIAWICIPAAKTMKQRLEMKGEKGSVDEIQHSIESGAKRVADAAQKVSKSGFWPVFARACEVGVGIILMIMGSTGLFAGTFTFFGTEIMTLIEKSLTFAGYDWDMLTSVLSEGVWVIETINGNVWAKILLGIVYFLPFIAMIYGGLMMIFKIKAPSWHPGLVSFLVWLLSVIALGIVLSYLLFSKVVM